MTRWYVVTQPVRGYRTVLVEARNAREAVELVWEGERGESIDTDISRFGKGRARLDKPRDGRAATGGGE